MGRCERERGAGTIWVVGFLAIIWLVGGAAVAVGGVRGVRHRVDAAADLAALAGAEHVPDGGGVACARVRSVAASSGVRVSRCVVRGEVVDVSVWRPVDVPLGIGVVRVESRARAGPVGVTWGGTVRCTECQ
ncbi:Rv3654c family TadE-like protein [Actinomadura roseirufa]|uniref:Rv3654c family TadE-like protein n=1 Tax=Actinomadura roseirufa TaxID=2094049 RepID=UPI0013F14C07